MSGGEQRRVTLARVFALQPRLVVADEPTSGLDPDRQESVLEDLFTNLPPDAGCILVTHEMTQARNWCHRGLVMLEGQVIEEIKFPDGQPTHPYAKMLFDPWGETLAQLDEGPGVVVGDVDPARIAQVRASLPALSHRVFS